MPTPKIGDKVTFDELSNEVPYGTQGTVVHVSHIDNQVLVEVPELPGESPWLHYDLDRLLYFDLDGARWDYHGMWKHDEMWTD